MGRTRKSKRKGRRSGRRNAIKFVTGLGSRSVRDVGRGVGRVAGAVPVVGKPIQRGINVGSRMAGDAVTLVGDTTNRAAGILGKPLRKLFGMKSRTRRKKRKSVKRRLRKRKSRSMKRGSRSRGSSSSRRMKRSSSRRRTRRRTHKRVKRRMKRRMKRRSSRRRSRSRRRK